MTEVCNSVPVNKGDVFFFTEDLVPTENKWNKGEIKAKKGDSIFIPAGLKTKLSGNAEILYSHI